MRIGHWNRGAILLLAWGFIGGWLLLTAFLPVSFCLSPDTAYVVRVGLLRLLPDGVVWVRSAGGLRWIDPETGRVLAEEGGGALWKVFLGSDRIVAESGDRRIESVRLAVQARGVNPLEAGSSPGSLRALRGSLQWCFRSDRLITVNWVRLDDYLRSVLPSEMPAHFHPEALKAQAVVVRSYTLRRLNRHKAEGFDLCDSEHCQLYQGMAAEKGASSAAVEATAGELLHFNGEVVDAMFSASCGGATAPNEVAGVNQKALPYLRGVPDWDPQGRKFCALSPTYFWETHLSPEELSKVFTQVGKLQQLKVVARTPGGHVIRLLLRGDQGSLEVRGAEFRLKIGGRRVKSLMFALEREGEGWVLHGQGSGHGTGFCQWGAQGRALAGQSYRQILQAYFPGAEVTDGLHALRNRNHGALYSSHQ